LIADANTNQTNTAIENFHALKKFKVSNLKEFAIILGTVVPGW
jgi:hypothetical protein